MKVLSNQFTKSFVRNMLVAGLVLAASMMASAQTAGYDFFQTTTGAAADVSNITGVSPSLVNLQGVPIMASAGNTDTIMHRTANGSSPVNVFALFMKNSVPVTYLGSPVDLYVTVNNSAGFIPTSVLPQPDALSPSTGFVTITSSSTFDSNITVNADVIIVPVGASPTGPSILHQPANPTVLTTTGSTWSSTPPAGYPSVAGLPSGNFYPHPIHSNGPHPVTPAACAPSGAAPVQGAKGKAIVIQKCAVATVNQ
jgi:hypothetical protein